MAVAIDWDGKSPYQGITVLPGPAGRGSRSHFQDDDPGRRRRPVTLARGSSRAQLMARMLGPTVMCRVISHLETRSHTVY